MFCVWERSRAASISSRMYIGAGLNSNRERMSERARRDLWPPLKSTRLSFQTSPKATLTCKPSITACPCGGSSLALVPGSSVEKIDPKSLLTFCHVVFSASVFFFVEFSNYSLNLSLIILNDLFLVLQILEFLFSLLKHAHNFFVYRF